MPAVFLCKDLVANPASTTLAERMRGTGSERTNKGSGQSAVTKAPDGSTKVVSNAFTKALCITSKVSKKKNRE
jgi:hypothetical protein